MINLNKEIEITHNYYNISRVADKYNGFYAIQTSYYKDEAKLFELREDTVYEFDKIIQDKLECDLIDNIPEILNYNDEVLNLFSIKCRTFSFTRKHTFQRVNDNNMCIGVLVFGGIKGKGQTAH